MWNVSESDSIEITCSEDENYEMCFVTAEQSRIPKDDMFNEGFVTILQREFSTSNIGLGDSEDFDLVEDEDLCDDCLVIEHQEAFNKNLLKNVFGSVVDSQHESTPGCKEPKWCSVDINEESDYPKFTHWHIRKSEGSGWSVEPSPVGCEPLPQEVRASGGNSCFVTSSGNCVKEQLVSLVQEGLCPSLMDRVRPPLEIAEWCAARADCESIYMLQVSLLDKTHTILRQCSELRRLLPSDGHWQKVSFRLTDYPAGVRYILFSHFGQDTKCWKGHFGSKMAGGSVVARLPCSFVCRKRRLTDCMTAAKID